MKFSKFWHWYGRWVWAFAIDRGAVSLYLGPFECFLTWEKW